MRRPCAAGHDARCDGDDRGDNSRGKQDGEEPPQPGQGRHQVERIIGVKPPGSPQHLWAAIGFERLRAQADAQHRGPADEPEQNRPVGKPRVAQAEADADEETGIQPWISAR